MKVYGRSAKFELVGLLVNTYLHRLEDVFATSNKFQALIRARAHPLGSTIAEVQGAHLG